MLISHRRNTIADLVNTPTEYGIEVDIRSAQNRLITQHDPLVSGEDFEEWLSHYSHGTLILNIKEEGLESPLIELMKKYQIHDYFFLDQSFPFLIKWSNLGHRNSAVRVSEYESIETALTLSGKINWIWVDCFNYFPLSGFDSKRLQAAGFRLCLVSPELQGRSAETEIPLLSDLLKERHIQPHAICTKNPEIWEQSRYEVL
jgi:hypothetical protein